MTAMDSQGTGPVLATPADVALMAQHAVGRPVRTTVLKHKPGRRCTWLAEGGAGTAVVKTYTSNRATDVAARVAALGNGPALPMVPEVLGVDEERRAVVLSEVPGTPLGDAVLAGDLTTCRAAGASVAGWHKWWHGRPPPALAAHTAAAELEAFDRCLRRVAEPLAREMMAMARGLATSWPCDTAVHRDLYEDQVVVGHAIGLIDLDDAAAGPPELDVGNLLAHLDLLGLRHGPQLVQPAAQAILTAYLEVAELDRHRLDRCRRLTLLRLACIHSDARLTRLALRHAPGTDDPAFEPD